jgi:methionyl-tRNA formyltransferase
VKAEMPETYILAARTAFALEEFARRRPQLPGDWIVVTQKQDLTTILLASLKPRYIFFLHWSWLVPEEIVANYECVCFHMTDLPYGRGGSPLQNLISRGAGETKLSALRMEKQVDAGPIYGKWPLSLAGKASEIYGRAAKLSLDAIAWMIAANPTPLPQAGAPTHFTRRTPDQSRLPEGGTLARLHDHIRMLDADGYPRAFIEYGGWRIELGDAHLVGDELEAKVRIVRSSKGEPQ